MKRPLRDTSQSHGTLTRRALVLGGLQLGVIGVLGARMRFLQVDQAEEFRELAEENRINIRLLPPARGLIYDRDGGLLAGNEPNYRVVMVREDAGDIDMVLARLRRLVAISNDDIEQARVEMLRRKSFVPVTVTDRLTWDDIATISTNAPALPGITAEVGLSRYYPLGADFAHIVGYVGPVSDYDLQNLQDDPDPLLQIPRFQIGKLGVEGEMEKPLRGKAGVKRIEVNAIGRIMRELGRVEGTPGADIQLTIDPKLQGYVSARLEGESAAACVIDLENGDVRSLASAPSFDPNLFVRGISVAKFRELNDETYRPMYAKAFKGTYPPGSTFKMVVALAALEAGVLDPEETILCRGFTDVADVRFHCWKGSGHGNVNLHESLKQSCDCFYYEISQRVGIDRIADMARRLGVGIEHDLPLSVSTGRAPDKQWKQDSYGQSWRIGDTVNASIGQGYVHASPLQLAIMTARLATGRALIPRLINTIDGVRQPSGAGENIGINENHLRRVRSAMDAVSNHRRGTAVSTRILHSDVRMAGKTGTSQVRRITAEERERGVTKNEDLPWERRDHALFVGFAPVENPRFAVSVVVEHGGGGSTAAAPIARDIMLQALFDGPPPLTTYPPKDRRRVSDFQEVVRNRVPEGSFNPEQA